MATAPNFSLSTYPLSFIDSSCLVSSRFFAGFARFVVRRVWASSKVMGRNKKRGLRAWLLGGRDDWRSSIGSGVGPRGLDTGRLKTPFAFVYLAGVG